VDSAQQIIAEVGPTAATFPSEKQLSSWVGARPGGDERAGVNYGHRSPSPGCPSSVEKLDRIIAQGFSAGV